MSGLTCFVEHVLKFGCGPLLHTFKNVAVGVCGEPDCAVPQALADYFQMLARHQEQRCVAVPYVVQPDLWNPRGNEYRSEVTIREVRDRQRRAKLAAKHKIVRFPLAADLKPVLCL